MVTMTATKMLTYNNRRLVPGEDFEAKSHRDMKVILATRKAKLKRPVGEVEPPPPELKSQIVQTASAKVEGSGEGEKNSDDDNTEQLAIVREEYKRVIGRAAYHGWDVATLREKIEAAGS